MKNKIILIVTFAFAFQLISVISKAQINKISINKELIKLTVKKETNTLYYNIEGSNDSLNFETVKTFYPAVNTMLPFTYNLDVWGMQYKYFRVRQITTGNEFFYSGVVAGKQAETEAITKSKKKTNNTSAVASVK